LIGYAARALRASGLAVNPELTMGVSIPMVIFGVWLGIRRIHRMVHTESKRQE
jgi:uncharacterized membrane-anchored protein